MAVGWCVLWTKLFSVSQTWSKDLWSGKCVFSHVFPEPTSHTSGRKKLQLTLKGRLRCIHTYFDVESTSMILLELLFKPHFDKSSRISVSPLIFPSRSFLAPPIVRLICSDGARSRQSRRFHLASPAWSFDRRRRVFPCLSRLPPRFMLNRTQHLASQPTLHNLSLKFSKRSCHFCFCHGIWLLGWMVTRVLKPFFMRWFHKSSM